MFPPAASENAVLEPAFMIQDEISGSPTESEREVIFLSSDEEEEFSTTGASIRTSSRLRTQFKRDGYLDWKQANKILGWGRGSKSSVQRKQNQYQRIYEELCIFVMLENESWRYSSWLRRCYHSFVRLIEIL